MLMIWNMRILQELFEHSLVEFVVWGQIDVAPNVLLLGLVKPFQTVGFEKRVDRNARLDCLDRMDPVRGYE
jgi:hypothetical protein